MVNRSIQQKMLKMKRRNRHAVFSGASAKYAVRTEDCLIHKGEDTTTLTKISVPVGPISLSKAVINTGRGPDASRMQEYYQRLHSYDQSLPETLGISEPMLEMKRFELTKRYAEFIKGVPRELHICFLDDGLAKLDLFFSGQQFFWVEVDYKKKTWKRSQVYPSKKLALLVLELKKITWVEVIDSKAAVTPATLASPHGNRR